MADQIFTENEGEGGATLIMWDKIVQNSSRLCLAKFIIAPEIDF